MMPLAGETLTVPPPEIVVTFEEAVDASTIDDHTFQVFRSGGDEPTRTGQEAMAVFDAATADIFKEVGATPVLKTKVEGVVIGDGRSWDEFRLMHFPSQAAFSTCIEKMGRFMNHREAAMQDNYLLQVKTSTLNIAD